MEIRFLSAISRGIAALRPAAPPATPEPARRDLAAELNRTLPERTGQPLLRHVRVSLPLSVGEGDDFALSWLDGEIARQESESRKAFRP